MQGEGERLTTHAFPPGGNVTKLSNRGECLTTHTYVYMYVYMYVRMYIYIYMFLDPKLMS